MAWSKDRAAVYDDHHQPLAAIDPAGLRESRQSPRRFSLVVRPTTQRIGDEVRCGDVVEVEVRAASPNASHWIAAYSPARANVTATSPTKYAVVSEVDPSYVGTGVAKVRFQLACMRHDYDFVMYVDDWVERQGWQKDLTSLAVAVTRSEPVTLTHADGPRKPRVMYPPTNGAPVDGPRLSPPVSPPLAVVWSSGRASSAMPALRWWVDRPTPRWVAGESVPVAKARVNVVPASTSTYGREQLCGPPANTTGWRDVGFIHQATIVGAPAGATVRYQLVDALGGVYPAEGEAPLTLAVPPVARKGSRDTDGFTIAMFADMGRGTRDDSVTWHEYGSPAVNVSASLASDAASGTIDAAFLFGDLSYATGYASVWDEWQEEITPWASRVPFLVNMGNHEFDSPPDTWPTDSPGDVYGGADSGGECGVPTSALFPTPRASKDSDWWAVTVGPFRVISMNTEASFDEHSPQYAFIKAELEAVDRVVTPWVLFAGHRPPLVDSSFGRDKATPKRDGMADTSDVGVALELQKTIWPLLHKHKVTATFSGHNHVYQRHCAFDPGKAGTTRKTYGDGGCVARPVIGVDGIATYDRPGAVVNLVVGSAGAGFTRNAQGAAFSEKVFYEYGYLRVTAVNRTHLSCEFQEAQEGKGVLDRFVIIQEDWEEAATGGKREGGADGTDDAPLRKAVRDAWTVAAIEGLLLIGACAIAVLTRRKLMVRQRTYSELRDADNRDGETVIGNVLGPDLATNDHV